MAQDAMKKTFPTAPNVREAFLRQQLEQGEHEAAKGKSFQTAYMSDGIYGARGYNR
jgi:hypothetical protein